MTRRWRALFAADSQEPASEPEPREALGAWLLGSFWLVLCVWLGKQGVHNLVPGLLVAGFSALWSLHDRHWLRWFPPALALALVVDFAFPSHPSSALGPLFCTALTVVALLLVGIARTVSLGRMPFARNPLDRALLGAVGGLAALALLPATRDPALAALKHCGLAVIVFYATGAMVRESRSRWSWATLPVVAAFLGAQCLVWARAGLAPLAARASAADRAFGRSDVLAIALLCALPVTVGLAIEARPGFTRQGCRVAAGLGLAALVLLLLAAKSGPPAAFFAASSGAGGGAGGLALRLAYTAVFGTLARAAWILRSDRRHEAPRWAALGLTFAVLAVLELCGPGLHGGVLPMVPTVAAGLTFGAYRDDRGSAREAVEVPGAAQEAA